MINVLLQLFAEYDYIVKVNKGESLFDSGQNQVDSTLKWAGHVAEFERHTC